MISGSAFTGVRSVKYKDKLINFVFRLVADRDQADDIIQATMLKLNTHKHYYKNIVSSLSKKFGLKNKLMAPKVSKIVLNMGLGNDGNDKKKLNTAEVK